MTSKLKLLVATSAVSVAMLGANPAFAAGTASGTDITNNVSVAFSVGGVAQTAQTASDVFKVDRKINLTVAEVGTTTTTVVPGQGTTSTTIPVTTFTVTNTSNSVLDFGLAAAQVVGGTVAGRGTDNFDVTGLQVFLESGATPGYQAGEDTATFIDELAADANRTVYIIGNIPSNRVNGDVSRVTLTAQAREGGTAATQGAIVTQSTGANGAGTVETVFADIAGATDAIRDGQSSAYDDFTVSSANLTVTKTSRVIWDPFNKTTNPKAIPGAVVEYCILMTNSGAAAATNVNVTDVLTNVSGSNTDRVTFLAANSAVAADTTTQTFATPALTAPFVKSGGANCTTAGTIDGSYTAGTFTVASGNIPSIAASTAASMIFRVTVE